MRRTMSFAALAVGSIFVVSPPSFARDLRAHRDAPFALTARPLVVEVPAALAPPIEAGVVVPLSLAVADFDEDGTPDLIVGWGDGERGLLTLQRGDVAALHPHPGDPAAEPFLPRPEVVRSEVRPDFLAAGDFDADGHLDVVVAGSERTTLDLRRGNGRGGFAAAEPIELDGRPTAFAAGEVNRRDGLADLVVGIDGTHGPALLVFESPRGALRDEPESIPTLEPVTSIALGNLDADFLRDIVAETATSRITVTGRDRRLSLGPERRARVANATVEVARLSAWSANDAAAGEPIAAALGGAPRAQASLRLNRDAIPDRVVVLADSPLPILVESATSAIFTVDSTADEPDFSTADGVCDTDDSAGDGPCTLRAALEQANASPGADAIEFDIPGSPPHTIQPAAGLPFVTEAVTLDGTSEPDYAGAPVVELDGTAAGTNTDGLSVAAPNVAIRGLAINRFDGDGIEIQSDANVLEANHLGTDPTGTLALGNRRSGVAVWSGAGSRVGGTAPAARNLISGNDTPGLSAGLTVNGLTVTALVLEGNFVGTDVTGSLPLPNWNGVSLSSSGATVGGTTPGAGNLISGNSSNGLTIGGADALVVGNLIGTDASGTLALGHANWGLMLGGAGAQVGGTTSLHRNVIAASGADGVSIGGASATNVRIEGNYIGVGADGTTPLGNVRHGINFGNSGDGNTVGGTLPGTGNVIAHNGRDGVLVGLNDVDNPILGNSIFANGELAIDLDWNNLTYGDGVTANDPDDLDTGGNNLQNFPVLTSISAGGATIEGTLDSAADTDFRVEIFANGACDPSGHGEAESFLGATTITTDAAGDAVFSVSLSTPAPLGSYVTATATDPAGNTSELSACLRYTADADLSISKDDGVTEVLPGGQVTYEIVAGNAGPDDLPGAGVHDPFSEVLSCSWTCVAAGGATCTAGPVAGDIEDSVDLPVGASATYTAVCDVAHDATGTLENSVEIVLPPGATDPDNENNSATDVDALLELDWGDAPDPAYPTLWSSNGARHLLGGALFLGATVDGDADGQPTSAADGDDDDGADDEDGVVFTSVTMTGYPATLSITASTAGLLNAWLDLDGDGSWSGAGEQLFTDEPLSAGANALMFLVPANATLGTTFARFRVDSAGGLAPGGFAADGEVEDERIAIRFSTLDVPETGQTTSWAAGDDGSFQVGVPWPATRFVVHGDGTVTDALTGLVWTAEPVNPGPAPCNPGVTRNWYDSLAYVACLNANDYLGHADWRMPNAVEIQSLVHFQQTDHRPWWQAQGFAATSNYRWWSSTTVASGLSLAHTLTAFGQATGLSKTAVSGTAVWPVRGGPGGGAVRLPASGQVRCWNSSFAEVACAGTGQDGDLRAGAPWPSPRFEVDGDCVTDRLTGLTWSRNANLFGTRTWYDALDDALGLTLCGHDDWRLPTVTERRTLSNFDKRTDPVAGGLQDWLESQGFLDVVRLENWSGTSDAVNPTTQAWTDFTQYSKVGDQSVGVWPVRGNLQSDLADLAVLAADSVDPVAPGAALSYTIDVANSGPLSAAQVAVRASLPAGATFVGASGSGWSCGESSGTVTCTLATLPVGPAPPIVIEITTPATPGATLGLPVVVDSLRDDPVGENNGALESTEVWGLDLGDAPDPGYPTLLASDGARHQLGSALYLGAAVDSESDGQPSAAADGDDADGADDEDGVALPASLVAGFEATISVTASSAGVLSAWIDYNADGDWLDAGEQVFTDAPLVAGSNPLPVTVPASAAAGTTFARFRLDSGGGLGVGGAAADGEVEDYALEIAPSAELGVALADDPDPVMEGASLLYTVDVTNHGSLDATGVTLLVTLPTEVAFAGVTPGAPTCSATGSGVTCLLGAVAAGGTTQVAIAVDVPYGLRGAIVADAEVTLDQSDPVLANNATSASTTVVEDPDLLFWDGFETGDTSAWDATVGGG